jgi:glucokinase
VQDEEFALAVMGAERSNTVVVITLTDEQYETLERIAEQAVALDGSAEVQSLVMALANPEPEEG